MMQPESAKAETLGWASLVMISLFCHPSQIPGLLTCAFLARESSRLAAKGADENSVVFRATLFAIATRFALFALFERDFRSTGWKSGWPSWGIQAVNFLR